MVKLRTKNKCFLGGNPSFCVFEKLKKQRKREKKKLKRKREAQDEKEQYVMLLGLMFDALG